MGRSLKVATIRGIDVRLHFTFPLIVLWAALQWGLLGYGFNVRGALYGALLVLLLFVCVVLHELGHSLVAMRYGVRVKDITLLPIGGVAQMRRMPSRAWQELVVAIAGSAVNVAIALGLGAAVWLLAVNQPFLTPFRLLRLVFRPSLEGLVVYLLVANMSMALFNLIPAFPMDGGRMLRALLSLALGHVRATAIAARVGQVLAVLFLAAGVYLYNPVVMIVAVFIFGGAMQEMKAAHVRRVLGGITAGQAVDGMTAPALQPEQTLGSVTQLAVFNAQRDFPVIDEDGRVIGLLHVPHLNQMLRERGPWSSVRDVMRTDFLNARASDTLFDVQQLMSEAEADTAEVSDETGFLGVLTRERIFQLYQMLTQQRPAVVSNKGFPAGI